MFSRSFVGAAVALCALASAATAGTTEPTVPLQSSMSIERALGAVGQAAGLTVVAETPTAPFVLDKSTHPETLSTALQHIALAGDYVVLRRGHSVLFQRRYAAGDTSLLSVPEIRRIMRQVHALTGPLNVPPKSHGGQLIRFAGTLTPLQLEAARRPQGLAYTQLTKSQQQLWGQANNRIGYTEMVRAAGRLDELFIHWERANLEPTSYMAGSHGAARAGVVLHNIPTSQSPFGARFNTGLALQEFTVAPTKPTVQEPGVVELPDVTVSGPLRAPLTFNGALTLEQLHAAVRKACGQELNSPDIPLQRRLLIFAQQRPAAVVLQDVALLYGWELSRSGDKGYYFGIPRFGPSPEIAEFFQRLSRTVPPGWRNAWTLGVTYKSERGLRQVRALRAELQQLPEGWKTYPVKSLSLKAQRGLAAYIVESQLGNSLRGALSLAGPPTLLAQPERCRFFLDKGGQLMFRAPDGSPGPRAWGFALKQGAP